MPSRPSWSTKPSRSPEPPKRGQSMATDIKVPTLGESVTEATVARWLKKIGDAVAMDDPLVELETDKVTLEVNAPAAGTLSEIAVAEGSNVAVGAVLGRIGAGAPKAAGPRRRREPGAREERVRMTRLRRRIAERLKEAQNNAAMLTTFNEVDMTEVMALRERYRDSFEKKYGVRLGYMSLFVKACIVGLKEIPAVNAEIDGEDIIYKNHYDVRVAVGTQQGLVVPVVRDPDRLNFA